MSQEPPTQDSGVEERTFQTEVQQLLHLLIHSLYTQKEIFLRELISNSSEALNKIHNRSLTDKNVNDPDAELDIQIEVSSSNKTLVIRDSGIGMTRDEGNDISAPSLTRDRQSSLRNCLLLPMKRRR